MCFLRRIEAIHIDTPSVTEMDIGGVYEMERQTKGQKNVNATALDKIV